MKIEQVGVIGAGVMGAGIAAHVANAGVPVLLLDVVPPGANDRNALAQGALARLLKADPAPFMTPHAAKLVTPGNVEDDLNRLAACDWIIEAVVENPAVKSDLYGRLEAVKRPDAVVSSNTSTIPLTRLVEGRSDAFKAGFLITHFFNPPRYMRLLEMVAGPATRPEAVDAIRQFCDVRLGKGVVTCRDTPGFIANRIGTYWLQTAVNEAIDLGLTVEEADAVVGRPMGIPKTGVFGLLDLVGIDLMPHVTASMLATLPADDPFRAAVRRQPVVERMIADGLIGRKGPGGFYRLAAGPGGRVKQSIDLTTGTYRPAERPRLDSIAAAKDGGLRALAEHPDRTGRYAWRVLAGTLGYAAALAPQIADSIQDVDEAMRLGYNWTYGPFELIDQLGADWLAQRLSAEQRPVPPLLAKATADGFYRVVDGRLEQLGFDGAYRPVTHPSGELLLADVKRQADPLFRNASAALWDIGDGVTCFEFTSKMNALDDQSIAALVQSLTITGRGYRAMVIYNEGAHFSVGANIGLALFAINVAAWGQIETWLKGGQDAFEALRTAPFPVVGAPSGMALGGACEMLMHCDAVQAHAETYMGLVEVGVGLVPAWGGCKELLLRHLANARRPGGPMPAINQVFQTIGLAAVAKSAAEAKDKLFLRPSDGVTMNRDRLLADAKQRALALADGYRPPPPAADVSLPGPTAEVALAMAVDGLAVQGKATAYDVVVAGRLARVLAGGDTDIVDPLGAGDLLALERQAFLDLVRRPGTVARIEHMLETGKPLRN